MIGGILYRGTKFLQLNGKYIFADNQSGLIRVLDPAVEKPEARILAQTDKLGQQGITSFLETPNGDMFITVLGSKKRNSGQILKLILDNSGPITFTEDDSNTFETEITYEQVSDKYDMLCSRCHGLDGQGGNLAHLTPRPNFTQKEWQENISDEQIKATVINGGAALGLSEEIPAWTDAFSETKLELLVQKIRSFTDRGFQAK